MKNEIGKLIERIESEINKTPSGDIRNLLCDANIFLHLFQTEQRELLVRFLDYINKASVKALNTQIYVNIDEFLSSTKSEEETEDCLLESAFILENGVRLMVGSSCQYGITTYKCDKNWKPIKYICKGNPLVGFDNYTDFHKHTRKMHGNARLVKERSSTLKIKSEEVCKCTEEENSRGFYCLKCRQDNYEGRI